MFRLSESLVQKIGSIGSFGTIQYPTIHCCKLKKCRALKEIDTARQLFMDRYFYLNDSLDTVMLFYDFIQTGDVDRKSRIKINEDLNYLSFGLKLKVDFGSSRLRAEIFLHNNSFLHSKEAGDTSYLCP